MNTAETQVSPVLRYPGGKQRMLRFLASFLPAGTDIEGRYVEPFVGGGAIFLFTKPHAALLSDSNAELIDLYDGIKADPAGVWEEYSSFGNSRDDYHRIRAWNALGLSPTQRTARLLYLNRTCFKGNWRHNSSGQFNIGYGGQSRRWVITGDYLAQVSRALAKAELRCSDFEAVIDDTRGGDFLFLDPPYRRGEMELVNDHYAFKHFSFADQQRLADALRRAVRRGVAWVMTNSSHGDVLGLFRGFRAAAVPMTRSGAQRGEVVITSKGAERDAKVL